MPKAESPLGGAAGLPELRVRKILNNNVVVAADARQEETIIMGRGIGFNKRPGEIVDPALIEKTFVLSRSSLRDRLHQVLTGIPVENFLITQKIVDYAVRRSERPYNEIIYITLTDHVNAAIERYRSGIILRNPLLEEIGRLYPQEFEIGLEAVEIMKAETGLAILTDEAGFVALHFFNARNHLEADETDREIEIVQDILDIVGQYFKIRYRVDSISYCRFKTYLKYLAQELGQGGSHSIDEEVFLSALKEFTDTGKCVDKIRDILFERYGLEIRNEERLHLNMQIRRLVRANT